MAPLYAFQGRSPLVHATAFVHPQAVLIGDVVVEAGCFIGPCASLRGDFGRIRIDSGANIQDGCVLHCFPGREVVVETQGHVGHGAVLHGCRVGPDALIGMNAVIMDGAQIGAQAFVGAHSFVKSGTVVPARHLAAGSPATVRRELQADELTWKAHGTLLYQRLAQQYLHEASADRDPRNGPAPTAAVPYQSGLPDDAPHIPLREYRTGAPHDHPRTP